MSIFIFCNVYSKEIKAQSITNLNNEYELVVFDNGSIWAMPKDKHKWYWRDDLRYIPRINIATIDVPDNLEIGRPYSVSYQWYTGEFKEKLNTVTWEGIFICENRIDDFSEYGVVIGYEITNIASSPSPGLEKTVFLLNDGSCWLAPAHFGNFNKGEFLQVQREEDGTAIILKTIKWNGQDKEIFIPAKKLINGVYLLS